MKTKSPIGGRFEFAGSLLAVILLLGSFAAMAAAEPQFPLQVSENRRHLVDQGGTPFLYNADTPWMLFTKLTEAEAMEYIARRKEQGFTALQVMLTGFLGMTNLAGELPFAGTPPAQDFARPNEKFFAHVDRVVEEAERQGMLLAIAPAWSGCCGEGWAGKEKDGALKPLNANGAEKSREFGRWLGQRYGKFGHVMWILGGDNDPNNARAEIRALGLGLKDTAPKQLITYHAASTHSSTDVWPMDESWLNVSMLYSYFRGFNKAWNKHQPDVYEVSHAEFAKSPVRPFLLGESTYEGEHDAWGSALQARKQAYWAILGGCFGHAYGSPNWHLRDDWRKVAGLPGAESLRHLRRLFKVRPFSELEPDVKNTVAVAGQGHYATNDWATTARARDGRFVISYLPSPRALEIDLSKVAGKQARVSWMDAATGVVYSGGTVATQGTKLFSPPDADSPKDWVLILDEAEAQLAALEPRLEKAVTLQSIDHRGDCRHGVPAKDGETILLPKEKGLSLVAYGSEYGHHCGQDQGRFAYVPLAGDFDVAVQISEITNHGAQHFKQHATPAKAGLMLREGNNPADRYVAIWAVSNDAPDHYPDAFHFDARLARGAWLGSQPKGEFVYGYINRKHGGHFTRNYPDVWLRLKRTGDRVEAFVSKDGKTWTPPSTPAFELPLPKVVYVGVALSSAPEGSFEARSTATFKNLSGLPLFANDSTSAPTESLSLPGYCELRIYTVISNKLDGVLERFRDTVEPVRRKHGITTVGYWSAPGTTNGGTFAYLMSAATKEELRKQEKEFGADPQFKEGYAASNKKHGKTVDKITTLTMPTDATAKFDFTAGKTPRAFDLRIYSVLPGKLDAFRNRWRDFAALIYERHGLHSAGWWVAEEKDADGNDQLVCLLAGENIPAILNSIGEFHKDADWIRVEKETEANGKLRSGVTAYKLTPTDFSVLK